MLVKNLMSKVKVTLIAMSLSAVATVGYGQFQDWLPKKCPYKPKNAMACVYVNLHSRQHDTDGHCDSCEVFEKFYDDVETEKRDIKRRCMRKYRPHEFDERMDWILRKLEKLGVDEDTPPPAEYLRMFCGWYHRYWHVLDE